MDGTRGQPATDPSMQAPQALREPEGPGSDTRIYLVEDDPSILQFVQQALLIRPLWQLLGHSATLAHARRHVVASNANVFLVDLGLPDGSGEALLRLLARQKPEAELLVFTVFGEESRLVAALEAGATGYVLKGCSPEALIDAIEQIREGGAPISPLLARLLLKQFREVQSSLPALELLHEVLLSDRETEVLQQHVAWRRLTKSSHAHNCAFETNILVPEVSMGRFDSNTFSYGFWQYRFFVSSILLIKLSV